MHAWRGGTWGELHFTTLFFFNQSEWVDFFFQESNEKETVASLKKKLAGLQKTFARIKGSCTADNVNSRELGEIINENKDVELGESVDSKAVSVKKLKAEIKKKNKAIDKIADACMPGEELEYAEEE